MINLDGRPTEEDSRHLNLTASRVALPADACHEFPKDAVALPCR